jgi:trans-2,3-dihydro-3-hydroxyanthranilate isomerase
VGFPPANNAVRQKGVIMRRRFVTLDVFTNRRFAGNPLAVVMFAPSFGIIEDPATGSAAAAFAGVLARCERLADGAHDFAIEQGYEMGRPSLIELSISIKQGKLMSAAIAGEAVVVAEGTIEA